MDNVESYTIKPIAGDEILVLDEVLILGMSNPLSVDVISMTDEESGVVLLNPNCDCAKELETLRKTKIITKEYEYRIILNVLINDL